MKYVFWYLIAINCLCFALMGVDKARAVRMKWRISERTLFLTAALGGSLGGTLAMLLFRHKTLHPLFSRGFPILMVVHAVLLGLLLYFANH